jgi:hypothetical protein
MLSEVQSGFTGLNVSSDPAHLGPTEITQAVNAKYTLFGGVTPRLGTQRVHSGALPGPIAGLFAWFDSPNTPELLAVSGGNLYTARMTAAPPWTFALIGPTTSSPGVSFAEFTDVTGASVVYISDAVSPWKYNGTTVVQLTNVGGGAVLAVQNQRLFGIFNTGPGGSFNQTLFWSSLNSGDDLGVPSIPGAGGNSIVLTFGESALTGLLAYGAGLLISHFGGLSMFTGWSTSDITIESGTEGVSASTGAHSPFAMVAVENYAMIASDRGAYVLSPYGIVQQISRPLDTLWHTQIFSSTIPGNALMALHDKLAGVVYFQASTGDLYGYNYRTQGWFGPWTFNWTGATPTYLATGYDYIAGNFYVLVGGSDGFVRRMEAPGIGLDDVLSNGQGGNQYTMRVTTRPLVGLDQTGQPSWDHEKAWRWVDVQAQLVNPVSSQITATTYPTEGGTIVVPNASPAFNNQPDVSPRTYRVQMGGRGQALVVDIFDTPVSNPAGQNVYLSARAMGFDYGRRF